MTNNPPFRYLELGDVATQSLLDALLCSRRLSWFDNDASPDDFSVLHIFDSEANGLCDAVDAKQGGVNLQRRDLFSTAVDKLLEPPRQPQVPRRQDDALVSRPSNSVMM